MADVDPQFDLIGKVALVTGGGTGIGREIALALAEHGADLWLVGRRSRPLEGVVEEIADLGRTAYWLTADVTGDGEAQRCLECVLERSGQIDVLFNNAGRSIRTPAVEIEAEEWDALIDLNLTSVFLWSQVFGRQMLDQGSGSVVNITSSMGARPWKDRLMNAVTRAAVEQMTRALAIEWAMQGVRVNALAPGFVSTEAMDEVLSSPSFVNEILARTPQRRVLEPSEMRATAVLLAAAGSSGITGQVLRVDGGWTAW